jgi:OmcA/MtrC family decaheme c-type cytochrome
MTRLQRAAVRAPWLILTVLCVLGAAQGISRVAQSSGLTPHDLAYYLDPGVANFVRPGIKVKVMSAAIAQDGTITARVTVTDPQGMPLDIAGVNTPGAVTLRFIAAVIPAGKTQYFAYTTAVAAATLNSNPSQTQASTDSGGVIKTNADGDYTYTFKTKAPAGFDTTATHSIGVTAQRDLSAFLTYTEWTETSNDVFNFVPNGSAVKVTRSIVPTAACNQCHDPLIGHGGSRLTVEMCILCHQPQTINPDTGLTQDMNVLIHKIHMGKNLPSVIAGTPYRIWHRGAWSDFSNVNFPSGVTQVATCTVCHQNAPQAANYMNNPTRAACGSCHDDVNFASGLNHVNLPQTDDSQCARCHNAQGSEFDASVTGAHTNPTTSAQLPGTTFGLVKVTNTAAGKNPVVTFTLTDKKGNVLDASKMDSLSLILAGPTTDYSYYVTESATKATLSGGQYTYTFTNAIPAGATGSYVVGMEGYKNITINPGTTISQVVRDSGNGSVLYFSTDGTKVVNRRQVVSNATCNGCHTTLTAHGGFRNNVEYCIVCHNPNTTDAAMRTASLMPAQTVDFRTMIHKIHTGTNLTTDYTVMGHGSSVNNFNGIGYVGDARDCVKCHMANTYQLPLPSTTLSVQTPRDWLKPTTQPMTASCVACHTDKSAAAHAAINTSSVLGESCDVCHGPSGDFALDKVHAR